MLTKLPSIYSSQVPCCICSKLSCTSILLQTALLLLPSEHHDTLSNQAHEGTDHKALPFHITQHFKAKIEREAPISQFQTQQYISA
jgi:hypothetical protein